MDGKRSWMKVAGLWVSFLILHYTYDRLPIFPLPGLMCSQIRTASATQ